MRIIRILVILMLSVTFFNAGAHIINPSLEQEYTRAFLPVYFTIRLLPFFGLGFLTNHMVSNFNQNMINLIFTGVVFTGLIIGLLFHHFYPILPINQAGMLILAIFLIAIHRINSRLIYGFTLVYAFGLGFEYGIHLANTHGLYVYFGASLLTGLVASWIIGNIRFKENMLINISRIFGLFLFLTGLLVILLL